MPLAPLLLALAAQATEDPRVVQLADLGLTLTLTEAFAKPEVERKIEGQVHARWRARVGSCDVQVVLFVLPRAEFRFTEPEDVRDVVLDNFRDPERGSDPTFAFSKTRLAQGSFGWCPYGALAWGPIRERGATKVVGTLFMLGGILEEHGYSLEVVTQPEAGAAETEAIAAFLEQGVAYAGKTRDPKWTDEEAEARWKRDAPPKTHAKLDQLLRTKHYLILTNSSGGKAFGKKMEECYERIQKTYPFPETEGRALMPVFLFRTSDEYYEFYAKVFGSTVEEARKSKGVASSDFYATWFEATNDPVHVHEATHQIFANRLRLGGGGSWFQEGVAEYMSANKNDLNVAASAVKKGKHTPLPEMVTIRSLLWSAEEDVKGGDAAGANYALAALLIEFLRDSKFGKAKFQEWVHAVGRTPRNNLEAIERATRAVYGVGLDDVEKQWVAYCKKR